jgi:hypothetical protein
MRIGKDRLEIVNILGDFVVIIDNELSNTVTKTVALLLLQSPLSPPSHPLLSPLSSTLSRPRCLSQHCLKLSIGGAVPEVKRSLHFNYLRMSD